MASIKVTIIPEFKETFSIVVGDSFEMKREPENEYDHMAVAVKHDSTIVGHLAASEGTIQPETKAAKEMFKKLGSKKLAEAWVKVIEKIEITASTESGTKKYPAFIGECNFIPVAENASKITSSQVIVGGSFVKNSMRPDAVNEIETAIKANAEMPTFLVRASTDGKRYLVVKTRHDEDSTSRGELLNPPAELISAIKRLEYVPVTATGLTDREGNPLNENAEDGKKCYTVSYDLECGTPERIVSEIKRAVREGRGKFSDLEEKVNFMMEQAVPFEVIAAVLKKIDVCPESFENDIPYPETLYTQSESMGELTRVLAYRISGMHLRLIGNKGSGKNTLAETVDWILHRPQYRLQGNAEMDKLDLLGSPSLKEGTMTYQLSDMLRFLEVGGDVVLDEGNTIKPEVADLLHSLTDNARQIQVPGYGLVKMHPESTITITMNEDYVGTTRMNEATIDRFTPIQMSQPTSIKELLEKCCPKASAKEIAICDKVYLAIKNKIIGENSSGSLEPDCMTIRGFIDALETAPLLGLKTSLLDNVAKKPQDAFSRMELCEVITSLVK